jgi:hypothetical protein
MNLCKYSNLFGEPSKGIHKYRLFDVAIIDVSVVIIFGYIIHANFKKINSNISLNLTLLLLFIIGIIMHRLFCVRTKIDRLLFD